MSTSEAFVFQGSGSLLPKPKPVKQNRRGRKQDRSGRKQDRRKQDRPSRAEQMKEYRKQRRDEQIIKRRAERHEEAVQSQQLAELLSYREESASDTSSSDTDSDEPQSEKYSVKERDNLLTILQKRIDYHKYYRKNLQCHVYKSELAVACKALQDDYDVVLAAVRQVPNSLRFASPALQANTEIVLAAIECNRVCKNQYHNLLDIHPLQYASPALKADKEVVRAAVSGYGLALTLADAGCQGDIELVLVALDNCRHFREVEKLWLFLPSLCRCNKQVALVALKCIANDNGGGPNIKAVFNEIAYTFNEDREVIHSVIRLNGDLLRVASKQLQNDKEVVLSALSPSSNSDSQLLWHASERLKDDKEVVLAALEKSWFGNVVQTFKCVSERLRDDKDVLLAALKKCEGQVLALVSNEIVDDRDFMLHLIKNYHYRAFDHASERLQEDPAVLIAVITRNKKYAHFITDSKDEIVHRDDENDADFLAGKSDFMLQLMDVDLNMFFFASDELKANLDFIKRVIELHPDFIMALCYLALIESEMGLFSADATYRSILEQDDDGDAKHFARLLFADFLVKQNRLEEAQEQLKSIVAARTCPLAHLKLGLIHDLRGEQVKAQENYNICAKLDPQFEKKGLNFERRLRDESREKGKKNDVPGPRDNLGDYYEGDLKWMRPKLTYDSRRDAHYADAQFFLALIDEDQYTSNSPLTNDEVTRELQSRGDRASSECRMSSDCPREAVRDLRGEKYIGSVDVSKDEWNTLAKVAPDLINSFVWDTKRQRKKCIFKRFRKDAYFWRYEVAWQLFNDHEDAVRSIHRHKKTEDADGFLDMVPSEVPPLEHRRGVFGYQPPDSLRRSFLYNEAYFTSRLGAFTAAPSEERFEWLKKTRLRYYI